MVRKSLIYSIPVLIVIAVGVYWFGAENDNAESDPFHNARRLYAQRKFEDALKIVEPLIAGDNPDAVAIILAGECHARLGNAEEAMEHYDRVPESSDQWGVARFGFAEVAMHSGLSKEAEAAYRDVLTTDVQVINARSHLVFLLHGTGRRFEALPFLYELLEIGELDEQGLLYLADTEQALESPEYWESCGPDDSYALMGQAWFEAQRSNLELAERQFRLATEALPDEPSAFAGLGLTLLTQQDDNGFDKWLAEREQRSAAVQNDPRVLLAVGRGLKLRGKTDVAAHALIKAIRQIPDYRSALLELAQVLTALDRTTEAHRCTERAAILEQITRQAARIRGSATPANRRQIVTLLRSAGRIREALLWCTREIEKGQYTLWATDGREAIVAEYGEAPPRLLPEADISQSLDPDDFPKYQHQSEGRPGQSIAADWEPPVVNFVDIANEAGISFRYDNADEPETEGKRFLEFQGGGVGILDYNGDNLPDIYLAQGCAWPIDGTSKQTDRLFRNDGDGTFTDVTTEAKLGDNLFTVGVGIGDVDNDGWPDIAIGNLGPNKLYHNNGDGTFTEWKEAFRTVEHRWTTNMVIADLSGDGLPDIYETNYVGGPQSNYVLICDGPAGPRSCSPAGLPAGEDRFWLNKGDGRFEDMTKEAGFVGKEGYGLGTVVADLNGDGLLDVFVANDTSANFAWFAQPAEDGAMRTFSDQAIVSGLAYGLGGNGQACMGIGVGDVNRDGMLDLAVTNFHDEPNNIFRQVFKGFYSEDSEASGMASISLPMLSFGIEFFDSTNNGWQDILITSGDIDDYTKLGRPYQQRSQIVLNERGSRFHEVSPTAAGPFFAGKHLGRGVAIVDWNQDGLLDAIVTYLDRPLAVLKNTSPDPGNFLRVDLAGTSGSRDAIGTKVVVHMEDHDITLFKTAGGGFLSCNESTLHAGLGARDQPVSLTVHWAGGKQQAFADVPANCQVLLTEGKDNFKLIRGPLAPNDK